MSTVTTITREQIFQLLADAGATRTHSCCGIDSKLCSLDEWRGNMEAVVKMAYAAGQQAEREACLRCYSPDDTATDWADKIRARSQG